MAEEIDKVYHSTPPLRFSIIESTLREGEQFVNASFSLNDKIRIAESLDSFGVEYIELTNPSISSEAFNTCKTITNLNLGCKVVTHIKCCISQARVAIDSGVDGIDILFGTSSLLREFSPRKDLNQIIEEVKEVIVYIKKNGLEVRISSEDSFRSDIDDLLKVYTEVDKIGVDRVGIADTIGIASPLQTYNLVKKVRSKVQCDIEFHGHNDTGCAIANSYEALRAGATHIDTTVLGIGERNGITSLGGLIARMYPNNEDYINTKYDLTLLHEIEKNIAKMVSVQIPFNNFITGFCSFFHKNGGNTGALLNEPQTYEIFKPEDFGIKKYLNINHKLSLHSAVKFRSDQLGLKLDNDQINKTVLLIKNISDLKKFEIGDIDSILQKLYHRRKNGMMISSMDRIQLEEQLEKDMEFVDCGSPGDFIELLVRSRELSHSNNSKDVDIYGEKIDDDRIGPIDIGFRDSFDDLEGVKINCKSFSPEYDIMSCTKLVSADKN